MGPTSGWSLKWIPGVLLNSPLGKPLFCPLYSPTSASCPWCILKSKDNSRTRKSYRQRLRWKFTVALGGSLLSPPLVLSQAQEVAISLSTSGSWGQTKMSLFQLTAQSCSPLAKSCYSPKTHKQASLEWLLKALLCLLILFKLSWRESS